MRSPTIAISAKVSFSEGFQEDTIYWRVKVVYTLVLMISAADKTGLQIDVDEFSRHTMRERFVVRLSNFNDNRPPSPVHRVKNRRWWQPLRLSSLGEAATLF